jgi:omega-6 fatty acid desaturase (delta-12 desaturase)
LERRGTGDVETLTVAEYQKLTPMQRLRYKLVRSPFTVFAIAPAYVFLLRYRFPFSAPNRATWISTLSTNLVLLAIGLYFWHAGELATLCLTHGPMVAIMATLAVWLFFVEHQFEDTYWVRNEEWNSRQAALWGSSHVDLPRVFRYFTANIGPHHIHHLNCRIPNYRLYECLERLPELRWSNRLTLREALRATTCALWDEQTQKLVSIRSLQTPATAETGCTGEAGATGPRSANEVTARQY